MIKRIFAILILAVAFSGTLLAQDTIPESSEFDMLISKSRKMIRTKPNMALELAAQARQMAELQGDSAMIAMSYKMLGNCYYQTRVYYQAMELQFRAFDIYSNMGLTEDMASCMVDISRIYCAQEVNNLAESYCIKAIEICQQGHYPETMADALTALGRASLFTNLDLAMPNLQQAKRIYDSIPVLDKSMELNFYMARVYSKLGVSDSALNMLDASLEYYATTHDSCNLARTYHALGDVYSNDGDVTKALSYYNTAIAKFTENEMLHDAHVCILKVARLKMDSKDYAQALQLAMKVYQEVQLEEALRGNSEIMLKHRACRIIYLSHNNMGNSELALKYCERFAQTGDSVFLIKSQEQFSEFLVGMESQQKQKEIEMIQVNAEKELLMVEKKVYNRNLALLIIVILLVVAMVVIYYRRFKEKVRNNTSLTLANTRMEQEIKERKIAETELRNSEERYRILFRKTPVGIVQFNDRFIITAINERCNQIFGIKKNLEGKDVYSLVPQKYFEGFNSDQNADETNQSDIKHEIKMDTPSGEVTVSVTLKPYLYNTGTEVEKGGIMIVEDITERLKAEVNTNIFNAASNNIISLMPDAIFLLDSNANYLFARVPHLPVASQNAYIGKNIREMVAPELLLPFLVAFNSVRKTGEPQYAEFQPDDNMPNVYHEAQFTLVEDGRVLVTIRDISRQKIQETKLKTAKNNAESGSKAKSEFILGMTTEIKPPLETILRNCEHVVARVQDVELSKLLKEVLNSALFVNETFTDILKLTEVEAVEKHKYTRMVNPVNVATDVFNIFKSRADEKKLEYTFVCGDNVPSKLMIDEVRLRQILFNIISNGIKYTEKGSVKLELLSQPVSDGAVNITFRITDTGVGLTQEQKESIFSATNGKKGMSLTKKMADVIKANLWVDSQEGKGSVFTFQIPDVMTDVKKKTQVEAAPEQVASSSKTVAQSRKKNTDAMREYISVLKYAVIPEFKSMKNEISFGVLMDFVNRFREQSVHYHIDKGTQIADELLADIKNYDIQNITMNIRKLETYIVTSINELQGDTKQ
ncbi:MAG: tetratricopeptide repeat protein [Bacteroidales bacterium]|nr:tetratricopeptide repeat protein [Bacteroidales bacterium]